MRWTNKTQPKAGEIRVIIKFLFFPTKTGNETRWLEFAKIRQKFWKRIPLSRMSSYWSNEKFINLGNL